MKSIAISKVLKALPISLFLFLFSVSSSFAQTQPWNSINPFCEFGTVATIQGFECVVYNVLRIAVQLAGVVLFIMFLIGGFKYLTASGDPKQMEAAKGTLTHAIIGLVVIIFAFLFLQIIKLVTGGVNGVDVSNFKVYR